MLGPGDALDRRGDGRRPRLPDRVRQGPGRGRRGAAARRARSFITVTDSDKPGASAIAAAAARPRLPDRRHARHGARRSSAWASRSSEINKIGEGSPHVVDWIERGEVDLVVNTPTGSGARTDGWEIRRAAVARGIPCLTTLSGGLAAARAIARRAARRARGALAAGDPPRRAARAGRARERREAPFGRARRSAPVAGGAARRSARTSCSRRADPDGPRPEPGPVLHARRGERLGRGRTSARSCRARSRSLRAPTAGSWSSCSRTSARARTACASCEPGDGLWVTGPLGAGFTRRRRRAPRRCSCGGGVGIAPLAIWQDELLRRGRPRAAAARLPRRRATPPAPSCCRARSVATDDGSRRPPRPRHRAARRELDADAHGVYACGPPAMLEAVRALCDARGVPAQLALESGMACGFGACFGCVVPLRERRLRRASASTGRCSTPSALAEVPAH